MRAYLFQAGAQPGYHLVRAGIVISRTSATKLFGTNTAKTEGHFYQKKEKYNRPGLLLTVLYAKTATSCFANQTDLKLIISSRKKYVMPQTNDRAAGREERLSFLYRPAENYRKHLAIRAD